jgi:ABC-type phosphate/phosphonate transport system permease subunit
MFIRRLSQNIEILASLSAKGEKMEKQQKITVIKNGAKVLVVLAFLFFFVYSFQSIVDWEWNPRRQERLIRILTAFLNPNLFEGKVRDWVLEKMWETIQMAFLATTISAFVAIPFTFLSVRPSSVWGRGFNILLQPILSIIRAVHPLTTVIFAIILFGIGPTAGVLALTLFSTAVLVVKYSEYVQQHTDLDWSDLLKVHFPGLAFKHFPVNILIATVLGFMGGGGIGHFLLLEINLLNYRDASVAILACIIVIAGLDLLARAVWYKIQGNRISPASAPEVKNLQ